MAGVNREIHCKENEEARILFYASKNVCVEHTSMYYK